MEEQFVPSKTHSSSLETVDYNSTECQDTMLPCGCKLLMNSLEKKYKRHKKVEVSDVKAESSIIHLQKNMFAWVTVLVYEIAFARHFNLPQSDSEFPAEPQSDLTNGVSATTESKISLDSSLAQDSAPDIKLLAFPVPPCGSNLSDIKELSPLSC
ncbi:uncharacterized protein G2W53_037512 [Senna tora]|uniref:Uncharacterized protein n=1 Tax=Senna tora TaxID=362788 RepID=A0A834SKK3_9FABA|nr:uncharacterized protein G2W53_037512 [Senna tora]